MSYQMKEFSELTKIPIETLRYYEREEIIQPDRNELNYRVYSEEDRIWANCVKSLKQSGMSISEIKEYTFLSLVVISQEVIRSNLNIDSISKVH